jgi:hypothetical protein
MTNASRIVLVALLLSGCGTLPEPVRSTVGSRPTSLPYANPRQSDNAAAPVAVTLSRDGDALVALFKVTAATLVARPQLAHDEYPYDFDVVEIFVRNAKSSQPGYFEFEVSPYNQSLQVNVIEPRQQYCFGIRNGFTHSASRTATGWEAQLRIPLASIGWSKGQPLELVGNAYAALGETGHRIYWSLFELPPGKPDFHVPAAFRPFFEEAPPAFTTVGHEDRTF